MLYTSACWRIYLFILLQLDGENLHNIKGKQPVLNESACSVCIYTCYTLTENPPMNDMKSATVLWKTLHTHRTPQPPLSLRHRPYASPAHTVWLIFPVCLFLWMANSPQTLAQCFTTLTIFAVKMKRTYRCGETRWWRIFVVTGQSEDQQWAGLRKVLCVILLAGWCCGAIVGLQQLPSGAFLKAFTEMNGWHTNENYRNNIFSSLMCPFYLFSHFWNLKILVKLDGVWEEAAPSFHQWYQHIFILLSSRYCIGSFLACLIQQFTTRSASLSILGVL